MSELCREHGMSNASFYKWRSKFGGMDASLISRMKALEEENKRLKKMWGFGLCYLYLRNVKGFGWNHKRVYRIYRELELNMRIKPRKNAYIERYNRTVRTKWLGRYHFDSIEDVQALADEESDDGFSDCLLPLVDYLPDKYKNAIRFVDMGGGKQTELATDTGLTVSAAKSRVQRGRHMLKEAILGCCLVERDGLQNITALDSGKCGPDCC